MNLNAKVTFFFVSIFAGLLAVLIAISLYAFRNFSIASATDHIRTAGEIVRVHLTESMINGVIDKRESFLRRLVEVQGLKSARVIRSPEVEKQFGKGLSQEAAADDLERQVLVQGKPRFELVTQGDETLFRGVIPYIATANGNPNCLQCHQVSEGAVLGAVSMSMSLEALRDKALFTVAGIGVAVAFFALLLVLLLRRLLRPISDTAIAVEEAVQRALRGDFKAHVEKKTNDEIGQIATDMNRLLTFLDDGLNRIGTNVARLTERTPAPGENLLTATIDMVDGLTKAAHFKQAIEEDEVKIEIYQRLSVALQQEFKLKEFSLYEVSTNKKQMKAIMVDGELADTCRWCDPQILIRPEACRVRRTGHVVDSITSADICYSFRPPTELGERHHVCFPVIQSGAVGSVVQLVTTPENAADLLAKVPFINVYLRETAPVLETKRLMENLRDSTLRDPMTGLNNRRFLEEYVETLVSSVQRKRTHVAILMLDLDYFKMVNDTYGHDAGDAVLKALSSLLKQSVRASDLVIRYGGEEFLIILVDSEGHAADNVAEKIRLAVEGLKVQIAGITLQKTISIGIADFPTDSDTFWQAVKFADVAMYQAKDQGRNRVIRFNPAMWSDNKEY
ncbi:sensor domain-containing diguanylate cyclase [Ferribacterium limneticum]|uniref:sensor domain-containing diguanylate cyclase n=1 Tax=Ferribacterium limneticum TaxID=76259 RepID=UPI001CF8F28A|nr:GGDEF domain-containing protein [Ferribacterium limneticum]UCV21855.1 GGDEF domain-containing protein [Ferribacterium limneticum]